MTLENIPTRTMRFDYLDGLEIRIRPADLELNPLFRAGSQAWLPPLTLAARLPDDHPRRMSDEQAERILARIYGMSVTCGSTDAVLARFSASQWMEWLVAHPAEFESIRDVAMVSSNFVLGEKV